MAIDTCFFPHKAFTSLSVGRKEGHSVYGWVCTQQGRPVVDFCTYQEILLLIPSGPITTLYLHAGVYPIGHLDVPCSYVQTHGQWVFVFTHLVNGPDTAGTWERPQRGDWPRAQPLATKAKDHNKYHHLSNNVGDGVFWNSRIIFFATLKSPRQVSS